MSDDATKARKSSVGERRDSVSRLGSLVGLMNIFIFEIEEKRQTFDYIFDYFSVTFDGWESTEKNVNDRC